MSLQLLQMNQQFQHNATIPLPTQQVFKPSMLQTFQFPSQKASLLSHWVTCGELPDFVNSNNGVKFCFNLLCSYLFCDAQKEFVRTNSNVWWTLHHTKKWKHEKFSLSTEENCLFLKSVISCLSLFWFLFSSSWEEERPGLKYFQFTKFSSSSEGIPCSRKCVKNHLLWVCSMSHTDVFDAFLF